MAGFIGAFLLSLLVAVTLATTVVDRQENQYMTAVAAVRAERSQAGICALASANCTICTAYTVSGSCGWCGKTKQCLEGGAKGPYFGKCASGWVANPNKCPAKYDPCTKYSSNCSGCTTGSPDGQYACGWCYSTKKCMASNGMNGPIFGTCAVWSNRPFSCPGYVSPCTGKVSCLKCMLASKSCGWCASTSTCVDGTSRGPKLEECPDWKPYGALCPGIQSFLTTCTDCILFDQSVWCKSTLECLPGGVNGPNPGYTCDDWVYYYSECPLDSTNANGDICKDYKNCTSCAADGLCGWCASSQTCMMGSSSGPTFTQCDDWRPIRTACSAKLTKTVASCRAYDLGSCPAAPWISSVKICAASNCTAAECCSNTCASFPNSKCPKGTVKKSNSNYACQYYTCTATECCEGKCASFKCPSGTKRASDRTCFGRQCLKDDCCRSSCKTFKASACSTNALIANASKTYCAWYTCTAGECCEPESDWY